MNVENVFAPVVERLQRSASVETVYGEPVESDSRTVVPVARVVYGFGGGGGNATEPDSAPGFGGGGGLVATPVGALEVTETTTRFVRFDDVRRLLAAFVVGLLVGSWLGRRRN